MIYSILTKSTFGLSAGSKFVFIRALQNMLQWSTLVYMQILMYIEIYFIYFYIYYVFQEHSDGIFP